LNFLKAGIVFADLLNTVSPTYAQEIQTPYYGCGLQGVLAERRKDLFGIVNGVDYAVWSPDTDPHLPARYDVATVADGKARCKQAVQEGLRLPARPATPLLALIARLVDQKGLDILVPAAREMLQEDVQLAILGEGDPKYHRQLSELSERHPGKVGLHLGFDEALAHRIEAGADIFLMPSMFEPCGLNQMYSMRYGTPPVVRATGGLADTVVDCTPESLAAGRATGFRFVAYAPEALLDAVQRALDLYRRHPADWRKLQRQGMQQDWSWNRCAAEYERLYERLRS
jgi:starch synthase